MKSLKTEDAIRILREIGYDSVELTAIKGWDGEPAQFDAARRITMRKRFTDLGLKLSALMENLPPHPTTRPIARHSIALKLAAQLAHDLCPDRPPLIETILGGTDWPKAKELFLRRLPDWAKLADAESVVIAIKPHRNSAMNRPEQAIELFEALGKPPRLRMVYDYSHYAMREMPMDQTIRTSLRGRLSSQSRMWRWSKAKPCSSCPARLARLTTSLCFDCSSRAGTTATSTAKSPAKSPARPDTIQS